MAHIFAEGYSLIIINYCEETPTCYSWIVYFWKVFSIEQNTLKIGSSSKLFILTPYLTKITECHYAVTLCKKIDINLEFIKISDVL